MAKFREYFFEAGLFENKIYPGIPELLQALHSNGRMLAVATNKVLAPTHRILEHFDIARFFTFVSGDDMEGNLSKNGKRDIIRIALEGLGVTDVKDAVMIGDRKHDVIGASGNGIDSIGVLYGYGSREELADAGASVMVESVKELSGLLK